MIVGACTHGKNSRIGGYRTRIDSIQTNRATALVDSESHAVCLGDHWGVGPFGGLGHDEEILIKDQLWTTNLAHVRRN